MSSTSDREQPDGAPVPPPAPETAPTDRDAPARDARDGDAPTVATPVAGDAERTPAPGTSAAAGSPALGTPTAPRTPSPTSTTAPGPSRGPSTGGHRAARPAPQPPAPDPLDAGRTSPGPRVATPGEGAPTAPLPAGIGTAAPTTPANPGPTPATTAATAGSATTPGAGLTDPAAARPSAPVRRPSIRSTDPGPVGTPPPGTPLAAPPVEHAAYAHPATAVADLPGTGPSDATVPHGDASATPPDDGVPTGAPGVARSEPDQADAAVERPGRRDRRDRPAAADDAPRRGGYGRVLLGVLVGLVVGAVGVWVTLFGQSRILGVQAPGWDASYDPLGVVLVTLGVFVLALVLALGRWTAAVPVTAGLVASVIGVVYLYVPATTHPDTVELLATDGTRGSVERTVVAATSGTVFVVGALLLAAGLVMAASHRRAARV